RNATEVLLHEVVESEVQRRGVLGTESRLQVRVDFRRLRRVLQCVRVLVRIRKIEQAGVMHNQRVPIRRLTAVTKTGRCMGWRMFSSFSLFQSIHVRSTSSVCSAAESRTPRASRTRKTAEVM